MIKIHKQFNIITILYNPKQVSYNEIVNDEKRKFKVYVFKRALLCTVLITFAIYSCCFGNVDFEASPEEIDITGVLWDTALVFSIFFLMWIITFLIVEINSFKVRFNSTLSLLFARTFSIVELSSALKNWGLSVKEANISLTGKGFAKISIIFQEKERKASLRGNKTKIILNNDLKMDEIILDLTSNEIVIHLNSQYMKIQATDRKECDDVQIQFDNKSIPFETHLTRQRISYIFVFLGVLSPVLFWNLQAYLNSLFNDNQAGIAMYLCSCICSASLVYANLQNIHEMKYIFSNRIASISPYNYLEKKYQPSIAPQNVIALRSALQSWGFSIRKIDLHTDKNTGKRNLHLFYGDFSKVKIKIFLSYNNEPIEPPVELSVRNVILDPDVPVDQIVLDLTKTFASIYIHPKSLS